MAFNSLLIKFLTFFAEKFTDIQDSDAVLTREELESKKRSLDSLIEALPIARNEIEQLSKTVKGAVFANKRKEKDLRKGPSR